MSSRVVKELQEDVKTLKKELAKLGRIGITRQEYQTKQIEELKSVIVEAHEKEKKRLRDELLIQDQANEILTRQIKEKDAEIAALKSKVK